MKRVVVTGAGVISPLGDSPAALHAALCAGASAAKPIELFELNGLGPAAAGEIRPFAPRHYLGERNLRPVDRTSQLLLVAAGEALAGGGWTPERLAAREVGLVVGTTFCSVRTIAEFDRRAQKLGAAYASPLDFANSVINAAAGQAAIWFGLRGVNSTLSGGEASGLQAVAYAADLIAGGRAEALLAGGVEELCFESFLALHRAGRLAAAAARGAGRPVPFDARRNGFLPAEGAALLLLESAASAAARGAPVLGEVLGHAAAFHAAAPGDDGGAAAAVERAVGLALEDAGASPGDVEVVSASANGSVAGDRVEARGLAAALGAHASRVPVTAIKAMLGEALGASGGFQAVDLLETLRRGTVPGIAGLEEVEPGFPLGGAGAASRRVELGRRPVGLAVARSWDGPCCAVLLAGAGAAPAGG